MAFLKLKLLETLCVIFSISIFLGACTGYKSGEGGPLSASSVKKQRLISSEAQIKIHDKNRELKTGEAIYDCGFSIYDYYHYPVIHSFDSPGGWYNWIHRNLLGGLKKGQGALALRRIESSLKMLKIWDGQVQDEGRQIYFSAIGFNATKTKENYLILIESQKVSFIHITKERTKQFKISGEDVASKIGSANCTAKESKV